LYCIGSTAFQEERCADIIFYTPTFHIGLSHEPVECSKPDPMYILPDFDKLSLTTFQYKSG